MTRNRASLRVRLSVYGPLMPRLNRSHPRKSSRTDCGPAGKYPRHVEVRPTKAMSPLTEYIPGSVTVTNAFTTR